MYYFQVCRYLVSSENPKSICREGSICSITTVTLTIIFCFILSMIGMISVAGLTCHIMYNDIYDIYTGRLYDNKNKDMPVCHFGSIEYIYSCLIIGFFETMIVALMCALLVGFILCICACKREISESIEKAEELTGIHIDKTNEETLICHMKKQL